MKKLTLAFASALAGSALTALILDMPPAVSAGGGAPPCPSQNGDVNADGQVDLTDAVTILGHLFQGNPTALAPLCATQLPSGLPDTGQTMCHDNGGVESSCDSATSPGQDGSHATGCPSDSSRFIVNGRETPLDPTDDTVVDTCTGLVWEARPDGNGGEARSWWSALAHCDGLALAGHDDWRLPNVRELQSLVDYGGFVPAIHPVFRMASGRYWSSTSIAGLSEGAWFVGFGGQGGDGGGAGAAEFEIGGDVGGAEKSESYHVRAVRSEPR